MTLETLASAVGRSAVSNALMVPLQAVLSLAASAVIARALGTSLFGTFAVFTALRSSLLFYTDLGLSAAGAKFFPEVVRVEGRAGAVRLLFFQGSINLLFGLAWVLLLLAGETRLRDLFGIGAEHAFVIRYAAAGLLIEECGRVAYVFLWARFAHPRVNMANVAGTAALPVLVILAVAGDGGLRAILLATLGAALMKTVLLWIAVVRELAGIPIAAAGDRVPRLWRRFVQLGIVSWMEKLSGYLYGGPFLTLALATFLDKASLGQFALGLEFTVRVLSLVLSPTHGIILPAVSSVFADGNAQQRQRLFTAALRALGLWLAPAAVLLIAMSPYVIPWIYSESYAPAARLTQVLAAFHFVEYAIYSPANAVLLAGERLRAYSRIKLLSIAVLPLFLLLARSLPLLGIAALYGACRLAGAGALLLVAVRLEHLEVPGGFYARVAAAAALATAAALLAAFVAGPSYMGGVITAAIAVGATVVLYRFLHCLGGQDRDIVARLNLPGAQRVLRFFHV